MPRGPGLKTLLAAWLMLRFCAEAVEWKMIAPKNADVVLNSLFFATNDDYPYLCKCVPAFNLPNTTAADGVCTFDRKTLCKRMPGGPLLRQRICIATVVVAV